MPSVAHNKRVEIYARAIINGSTMCDAYRAAYPKSREWTNASVGPKASKFAKRANVMAKIEELQNEIKKEFVWEQTTSLKLLAKIAIDQKAKNMEKISAIKEINSILGFKATTKIDHTSSDGSMAPKAQVDFTKLSDSTLRELLKAKDKADEEARKLK